MSSDALLEGTVDFVYSQLVPKTNLHLAITLTLALT